MLFCSVISYHISSKAASECTIGLNFWAILKYVSVGQTALHSDCLFLSRLINILTYLIK